MVALPVSPLTVEGGYHGSSNGTLDAVTVRHWAGWLMFDEREAKILGSCFRQKTVSIGRHQSDLGTFGVSVGRRGCRRRRLDRR
jgi:hypothetical protein